ncbi:cell division protein FtsQ [Sulfurifustis variabilis]|uniref:Cell division protein FtsQ n=1 Tax=Sulfurifustis variabilis TaxID=1675686 RepID=A0A1B4V1B1_9GAMM|nr:cell division protein FtsQ/DivIB [Sulfurifustis variabilis]BAU47278.1 cell division protein FtsQ [Sulfurifustis variabilis]
MRRAEATKPRADRGALRTGALLLLALGLLVSVSYGVDWALRTQNFPVASIRFEGPFRRVTHAELESAVLPLVRANFFLVDLDAVKRQLEDIPWVHRVSVRRAFPQDLHVEFTEQRVVARWRDDAWLNASGEVVHVQVTDAEGLPRLEGPDGTAAQVLAAYEDFGRALAPAGLKLAGASLTPRRSWRLDLEGPEELRLTLVLDHEQPQKRLARFARFYATTLASQAGAVRLVDLRYTNGFAVEWRRREGMRVAGATAPRNEG